MASAGFALWSYQLTESAKRLNLPDDQEITLDLRPAMRAAAYRDHLSHAARTSQWIAGLLAIAVVPMGLAPLYINGGPNLVGLAAFVPIAGAIAIGGRTLLQLRIARACERFNIEFYGSGRHKYEAFEDAWATFERAHPRFARIAHSRIVAERAAAAAHHECLMAEYFAALERALQSETKTRSVSIGHDALQRAIRPEVMRCVFANLRQVASLTWLTSAAVLDADGRIVDTCEHDHPRSDADADSCARERRWDGFAELIVTDDATVRPLDVRRFRRHGLTTHIERLGVITSVDVVLARPPVRSGRLAPLARGCRGK